MEEMTTQSLSKQASKRIEWLDALKGVAIIAVVFGHSLLGYTENNAFGEYNAFFFQLKNWIYIWHMPFFMCLSGFSFSLAYYRDNKVDTLKVRKQILNLLLLYIMFSVLLYGLKIPLAMFTDNKMSLGDALLNLFFPNTIMWYLWVLAAYYFILICCGKLVNVIAAKPWIILGFLFFVAVVQKTSENIVSWRLCFGNFNRLAFYFCLGIVLSINRDKLKSRRKGLVAAGIAAVAVHCIYYVKWTGTYRVFDSVTNEFIATLIVLLMFEAASVYHGRRGLTPAIGRASLVIYLLHTYMVTAMKVVCIRMGLCSSLLMDVVVVVLSAVVPIAICYFVDFVRRKNRVIGMIFSPVGFVQIK